MKIQHYLFVRHLEELETSLLKFVRLFLDFFGVGLVFLSQSFSHLGNLFPQLVTLQMQISVQ